MREITNFVTCDLFSLHFCREYLSGGEDHLYILAISRFSRPDTDTFIVSHIILRHTTPAISIVYDFVIGMFAEVKACRIA